jgi:GNAT superfamily N-acetyltransferase
MQKQIGGWAMLDWYDTTNDLDWDELAALYRAAPLGNKNAAGLKLAFGNSMFKCLVREGGHLVGAGRALADGTDCAYLCDVAVLPSHQGTGLGKAIVARLAATLRGHDAAELVQEAPDATSADAQQLMARLTGNYKRGNERTAASHPRNRR